MSKTANKTVPKVIGTSTILIPALGITIFTNNVTRKKSNK